MGRNKEALKIWKERHIEQLRFVKMLLDNRGYTHNISNLEDFNESVGKIIYQDGEQEHTCFLTDSCITFKDSDLCIALDEFSLWLDS